MPLNYLPYQPDDIYSSVHRAGDRSSASIRLPLIKQIDWENITAASGSFEIERKCQQSWAKKEISQTLAPGVKIEGRKEKKKRNQYFDQRRATVVYVKYQITIIFTRLPGAHDSIMWVETTDYRPGVMDVVCLFCGQFAELMVFAVQYERKWNGIFWCCVQSCSLL